MDERTERMMVRAGERAMSDVDRLYDELGLHTFDQFPEMAAMYRKWMTAAWMAGATWALEEAERAR